MFWRSIFSHCMCVTDQQERISRSGSASASRRRGRVHCGLSERLSTVCEWRHPWDHRNTIITAHWHHSAAPQQHRDSPHPPPRLTHTPLPATRKHGHCVHGSAHCLRGGTADNVNANLCPSHDPTRLLWPVFFPPLNQTRWWSRVMRGGGWGGGVLCSAWHWGREREEGNRLSICDASTGTPGGHEHPRQDVNIIMTSMTQWGPRLLCGWVLAVFFLPPAWSQDTSSIYTETSFIPESSSSTWSLQRGKCSLVPDYFLHESTSSTEWKQQDQTTGGSYTVMLWLRLCDGVQMDGQQHMTLI